MAGSSSPGVYPGEEALFVEPPVYERPWFSDVKIPEARTEHETILELLEPATIKAKAVFEGKIPFEGVELRLEPGDGGYSRLFRETALTDYYGVCTFSPIPPARSEKYPCS